MVRVAVGEEYESRPDQVVSVSPPRILGGGIPAVGFEVERIHPEFWGDQLLFTTLEAEIVRGDGDRSRTRINRPLWVGPATFLRDFTGYVRIGHRKCGGLFFLCELC